MYSFDVGVELFNLRQGRVVPRLKATFTMLCRHAAELTKLQESLEFQHQASLQALQVELNHKLEDAKSRALEDLEKARQCSASELNALREAAKQDTSAAEQQHADKLAAREQEHTEEISKLRADHVGAVERFESESQKSAKEAAQLFLQEKQRTAAGIRKLQVNTATTSASICACTHSNTWQGLYPVNLLACTCHFWEAVVNQVAWGIV